MYTRKENQKKLNNSESGPKDKLDNQLYTFHVEHKKHIIKELSINNPRIYNMKKFKAIAQNRIEFLFAPFHEQAEIMWEQLYPCTPALIVEVQRRIYE